MVAMSIHDGVLDRTCAVPIPGGMAQNTLVSGLIVKCFAGHPVASARRIRRSTHRTGPASV